MNYYYLPINFQNMYQDMQFLYHYSMLYLKRIHLNINHIPYAKNLRKYRSFHHIIHKLYLQDSILQYILSIMRSIPLYSLNI